MTANLELLNPQDHRHLRLRGVSGAGSHFVQIVVSEFAAAAACCPIFFSKDPSTGEFYAGAMLAFKPGEPALKSVEERGGFDPLHLQREGFFISGEHIAIDRRHPRFSETEGEPLFDEAQQPGVCLRRIQQALGQLHDGVDQTKALIAALMRLKLVEPIDISLGFDDGERLALQGLYTVSQDALRDLGDADVLDLFRSGHLQLAYTVAGSLNQLPVIARLRNQQAACG